MPIGVDQKTINYIRNIIMTHDDKSLKEWIQRLADGQERIQEQNNQFFEWAKANKGDDKDEDFELSQPWEALGFGNSPAPTKKAEAPNQTPQKASQKDPDTELKKQLTFVDDGGGKDPVEAAKDYGKMGAYSADKKPLTADQKRQKRAAAEQADIKRVEMITKKQI